MCYAPGTCVFFKRLPRCHPHNLKQETHWILITFNLLLKVYSKPNIYNYLWILISGLGSWQTCLYTHDLYSICYLVIFLCTNDSVKSGKMQVIIEDPVANKYSLVRIKSGIWCRIWSWSPMPCEKHGTRDSEDKNRGRRPRFLSLLRPRAMFFTRHGRPWSNAIIARSLIYCFRFLFT